jgi:hypothetical protein
MYGIENVKNLLGICQSRETGCENLISCINPADLGSFVFLTVNDEIIRICSLN